jgi:hypothetical protein
MIAKNLRFSAPFLLLVFAIGCGSDKTVMPSGDLTEEQKAAYAKEMASVEEQESQGNINDIGKKKKK